MYEMSTYAYTYVKFIFGKHASLEGEDVNSLRTFFFLAENCMKWPHLHKTLFCQPLPQGGEGSIHYNFFARNVDICKYKHFLLTPFPGGMGA